MNRLPGLDLLRALAIVWVMLFHAMTMGLVPESFQLARYGWMGVDLFFALSGFLIGGQLFRPYARGEPPALGRFFARRLARTLPPYLLVLALYFTWPAFRERPQIQPLWQFATFTENLFIDSRGGKAFSQVWSLCIEEQFYLVAPLTIWVMMRRPSAWRTVLVLAAILVGGMAWRGYVWTHAMAPFSPESVTFHRAWQEKIYYATATRLDDLLGGVTLALMRAFRPQWWRGLMDRGNLVLSLSLAALAGSAALFVNQGDLVPNVIGYPILALATTGLVAAGASPASLIGRWRLPGAGPIAAMAYSVYLTHKQAYHLVQLWGGQGVAGPLALLAYPSAALALGAALYLTAERPALTLRDHWIGSAPPSS